MVQDILIVVSFLPDEHVGEKATEVLAELDEVEDLHAPGGFREARRPIDEIQARSLASEPGGEEGGVLDEDVGGDEADEIEGEGEDPLDDGVGAFFAGGPLVLFLIDVIFGADSIEQVMDEEVEQLG